MKSNMQTTPLAPFRLFFPLGTLAAVLGTLPWISFGFGVSHGYPRRCAARIR